MMKPRPNGHDRLDAIRRAMPGGIPQDAPDSRKVEALVQGLMHLQAEMVEIRRAVSPAAVQQIAQAQYAKEEARMSKLRDDCVKLLGLLREKGIVTHDEIRQALDG